MEINTILLGVMALACPVFMGLMMWMMNKNMGGEIDHSTHSKRLSSDPSERLAALRAERETLDAEIAEATRINELEVQRQTLLDRGSSKKDEKTLASAR